MTSLENPARFEQGCRSWAKKNFKPTRELILEEHTKQNLDFFPLNKKIEILTGSKESRKKSKYNHVHSLKATDISKICANKIEKYSAVLGLERNPPDFAKDKKK